MFYERTHHQVFRYAMVLCKNQADAEDVTAEAYHNAWRARRTLTGDENAAMAWIVTIARRIAIDKFRRTSRCSEEEIDDGLTPSGVDLEEIVITGERTEQVLRAIAALSLPQRDIVVLRYLLGWHVNQIAEHLGISENTASVRLRRALARVQAALAHTLEADRV